MARRFECGHCGAVFPTYDELIYHQIGEHPDEFDKGNQ